MARYYEEKKERGSVHTGASSERPAEKKGMIHEDHRAIANLPQEVMIKPYPMSPGYLPDMLDDTIEGVDRRMEDNHRANMRGLKPEKV